MAASESGLERKVGEVGLKTLSWLVGVLTMIAMTLGGYALAGVTEVKTKQAVGDDRAQRMDRDMQELKADVKRIAEAVGAKKP